MVFVSFWRAPGRPKRVVFGPKKAIFERIWRRKVSLIHVRRLCFQDRLIFVEFQKSLKTIGFTTIFWCADPDRKRFFICATLVFNVFMLFCLCFCFFIFFYVFGWFLEILDHLGCPKSPGVVFGSQKCQKPLFLQGFGWFLASPGGASVRVL